MTEPFDFSYIAYSSARLVVSGTDFLLGLWKIEIRLKKMGSI